MRTKALIMAGAALAVSLATSNAQVYSANVVGYVNQLIQPGFSLLANPLNTDTNGATEVLAALPDFSLVYVYNAGQFTVSESYEGAYYDPVSGNPVATPILPPGIAFFVNNAGSTFTNTYIGSVAIGIGASGTNALTAGFQAIGSLLPEAGGVTTVLNLTPADFSLLYSYSGNFSVAESYEGAWYDPVSGNPVSEPQATIAQGFFINNNASANWIQTLAP